MPAGNLEDFYYFSSMKDLKILMPVGGLVFYALLSGQDLLEPGSREFGILNTTPRFF